MTENTTDKLTRFGFSFERGGAHTARTIMLKEIEALLSYVSRPEAVKVDYLLAIDTDNCLGKRSGKTRVLTYRHMVDLYALDPSATIFRVLLFFWQRDMAGHALIALLCAYCRDSILRGTAPFILQFSEGATIAREALEEFLDGKDPGRFSKATLKSVAQNINSTWTQAGHLTGKVKKIRSRAKATTGAVCYALLLGYLTEVRGAALFSTEYMKLLECSFEQALELAEEASRRGWIVFKRVGDVMEVLFPAILNVQEMELIREQN
jgi:hypothetical protein